MENLKRGMRLTGTKNDLRIIDIEMNVIYVCNLKVSKLEIIKMPRTVLEEMLSNNIVKPNKEEKVYVIDENVLPRDAFNKYQQRKNAMNLIDQAFGPTYYGLMGRMPKPAVSGAAAALGISVSATWRLIRRYIKSGCSDYSLVDPRCYYVAVAKRGAGKTKDDKTRPYILDENDIELMKKYTEFYIRSSTPEITIEYAYMKLQEHYRDSDGNLTEGMYPSERQFRYFVTKTVSEEDIAKKKTSYMEARNNRRNLKKSVDYGVYAPMDIVEIDAHEMDVAIVDEDNRSAAVGRPILYTMIDVKTRAIVSATVSFDNNSQVGENRMFMNLTNPHMDTLAKHPNAPKYAMPYGCLPNAVRTDNGSDFISKETGRICRELNISCRPVPAGTGSLKGVVERSFRELEMRINPVLSKCGLIKKSVHSNHHEKAVLTISEVREMVNEFVYYHNTSLCDGIVLTKQQIDAGVPRIPCKVWEYEVDVRQNKPKIIKNYDEFKYTLYLSKTGSVNRWGIRVNNLIYENDKDLILLNESYKNSGVKVEVRMNPATIDYIVYRFADDTEWKIATLIFEYKQQSTFAGMSLGEFNTYKKRERAINKKLKQERRDSRSKMDKSNKSIVSDAKAKHNGMENDTKNIRENREAAKYKEQKRLAAKAIAEDLDKAANDGLDANVKSIEHSNDKLHDEYRDITEEEYQKLLLEYM